jgi:type IV secretion system protein VirD4
MSWTFLNPAPGLMRPDEYSVMLGRAHYFHALRLPHEEHCIMFAPPRTGKSGLLADIMARYPGPVLSTTTRADIYRNTIRARSALGGRTDVFNPQGIGRVPSTMSWDPISGCLDIATAIRRADAFALAVSSGGVEDGAFWAAKTSDYLRAFFYAAAFAQSKGVRYGLPTAARWALGGSSQEAEDILTDAGALDWAAQLGELRGEAQKTAATVRMYMTRALGFLFDPALAQSVTPGPDDDPGLSLESFVRTPGTLYMIASGQGEQSPLAPLFAALANEIHYTAGLVGSWSGNGRLPKPMLFALDEITQVCPVPLPEWLADSGGKGIQIIPVVHGEAQLRKRWGKDGARTILDTAGTWVVLPGISDHETLSSLSKICGDVAEREYGAEHHGRHPVVTESMIRGLPAKRALVKRTNLSPVICRVRQIWESREAKRAAGRDLGSRLRRIRSALRPRTRPLAVPVAAIMPPAPVADEKAA